MIIPINVLDLENGESRLPPQLAQLASGEVVLLELQGSLKVEGDHSGQLVGKLTFDATGTKPQFAIGHHLLEGKVVKLPKPLAVLKKKASSAPQKADDDIEMADLPEEEGSGPIAAAEVSYDVVAIIKKGIQFSKRPMPVTKISSTLAGSNVCIAGDEEDASRSRKRLRK